MRESRLSLGCCRGDVPVLYSCNHDVMWWNNVTDAFQTSSVSLIQISYTLMKCEVDHITQSEKYCAHLQLFTLCRLEPFVPRQEMS